jgi:4a-hydroxytetrahydrobiopterin dehydratase
MVSLRRRPAARQAAGRSVVLTDGGDDRQSSSPGRRSHATAGRHRVAEGLQRLPGWERRGSEIVKTFTREDFAHAMVFVNEVASAAEAAGHHPDIDIRWNKVTLALSSHAEGGLTDRDFQLAARIQEFDQPTQPA